MIAKGGRKGAGIGGAWNRSVSNITISGGTVTARGGPRGAGIGGGYEGSGSNITISGGTVTARGGSEAAGIGGGWKGSGSNITISGGSVRAIAGDKANAIGGGYGGGPVTPKNKESGGEDVYLLTIENPNGEPVWIDGNPYKLVNHILADPDDTNLYAYVTGTSHTVRVGGKTYQYTFADGAFTKSSESDTPLDWKLDIQPTVAGEKLTYYVDYTYENNLLKVLSDKKVTIKNGEGITTTTDRIEVGSGVNANVDLAGVNINASRGPAFKIADNSTGNVCIALKDGTTNILKSDVGYAGLQKNGVYSATLGELTITGTGFLDATGGSDGAGIGGGEYGVGSNITISGGFVSASGNWGAGIGGGIEADGSNITISGGVVVAKGGGGSAGIGGGDNGSDPGPEDMGGAGRDITISGGTVTAQGGPAGAGIGGGDNGEGSNITISGGSVKAIAGDGANAIGGGRSKPSVTPKNKVSDGEDVYLITIANLDSKTVTIDGTEYTPVNHKAADGTDTNLYAYLTGEHHTVQVGNDIKCYHYVNDEFVQCQISNTLTKDTEGHWYPCTEDTCTEKHSYAAHSGTDDGDCTTAVTCVCGYVLTAAQEAHSFAWTPSTQDEGKHNGSCQVDGCLQTDTGDCADGNRDHKCDECGRTMTDCADEDEDHMCDTCGDELTQHTGGQATCTAQAVCSICGKGYGDLLSCKSHGYSDVGQLEWYHDDVDYVIEKGLMIGYENGTFRPCESLTRAELVQILYNWAGKPQVEITGQFSDVEPDVWYAKAVSWAYEEGIVNGMGNGKFSPDLPITREQLATMLYRQAGEPETTGTLEGFADGDQASIYAIPALKWAVEQGILQGDQDEAGKTCLRPQDDAKRGEVAAMLHRYIG